MSKEVLAAGQGGSFKDKIADGLNVLDTVQLVGAGALITAGTVTGAVPLVDLGMTLAVTTAATMPPSQDIQNWLKGKDVGHAHAVHSTNEQTLNAEEPHGSEAIIYQRSTDGTTGTGEPIQVHNSLDPRLGSLHHTQQLQTQN